MYKDKRNLKFTKFYQKYNVQNARANHFIRSTKYNITDLPNETLLKVASFLDVNSLLSATCVSKRWRCLCEDNVLWEKIFQRYWDRGSKLYTRLQNMSLSADNQQTALDWKREFFGQCHSRIRQILLKLKRNTYTGVTDNVSEMLSKYDIKFQLCLINIQGDDFCFVAGPSRSNKISTILQWNSLDGFPHLHTIRKISVFALAPLVFGKDRLPVSNGPIQKSLVKTEDFPKSYQDHLVEFGKDEKISFKVSKSGYIIAVWNDSNEIAFVATTLHHHELILKCFLSTAQKSYSSIHKPVFDDIDPFYGLHGYQCHLNVHTLTKSLWEHKFSYLNSSKVPENGLILMRPDTLALGTFSYSKTKWKTELFSGSIADFAIIDITLCDSNNSVMWAGSYPVKVQSAASSDVYFKDPGQLHVFECRCESGLVSITFSKNSSELPPQVLLGVAISKINKWFAKSYR